MREYTLFVRYELYDELAKLDRHERATVLRFIESLRADPFQEPDYEQIDTDGTPYHARLLGRVAAYFWVGHAMCEVRILDLIDADTGERL